MQQSQLQTLQNQRNNQRKKVSPRRKKRPRTRIRKNQLKRRNLRRKRTKMFWCKLKKKVNNQINHNKPIQLEKGRDDTRGTHCQTMCRRMRQIQKLQRSITQIYHGKQMYACFRRVIKTMDHIVTKIATKQTNTIRKTQPYLWLRLAVKNK